MHKTKGLMYLKIYIRLQECSMKTTNLINIILLKIGYINITIVFINMSKKKLYRAKSVIEIHNFIQNNLFAINKICIWPQMQKVNF